MAGKKETRDYVRDLNEISAFFNTYQTPESRDRIKELTDYVESVKGTGKEVGLCIVGSVAQGMAEAGSDSDVYVFAREKNKFNGFSFKHHVHVVRENNAGWIEAAADGAHSVNVSHLSPDFFHCLLEYAAGRDFFELANIYALLNSSCVINREFIGKLLGPVAKHHGMEHLLEKAARDGLACRQRTFLLRSSFGKYESRLNKRGITIPKEMRRKIEGILDNYQNTEYRIFGPMQD